MFSAGVVPRRFPEAAQFFLEHGFAGSARELARQIGVPQPLLLRYFESWEDLFDAVFDKVFSGLWCGEMVEPGLRPFPSVARALVGLYDVYLPVVFNRQWMRLYVFAGLSDTRINRRYFRIIEQRFCDRFAWRCGRNSA
ncbi:MULTISPECIES: TetR/AcrR family transcriptional regulator [unclassified Paraburkholderia]|uniref:TetR/AcrR family transcriptional regulator n=1 Tax=unclassified Paraburkholderia TaxID=2615204 RepID=UPI0038B9F7B3